MQSENKFGRKQFCANQSKTQEMFLEENQEEPYNSPYAKWNLNRPPTTPIYLQFDSNLLNFLKITLI
jgi:hypothetical protein